MRHRLLSMGVVLVALAACTAAEPTTTTEPSTTTTVPVTSEHELVVYLLADPAVGERGPYLVPVYRTWMGETAEECAIEALLAGYTFSEVDLGLGSAVPFETQFLDVRIAEPTAVVDLTGAFESGGGTASMHGRLGQLAYTATQFEGIDRVELLLDGEPVTVFSGEGIDLSEPLARDGFEDLLAPIHIEYPAWEDTVEFPMTLRGSARTPSEGLLVTIVDWDGLILYERAVSVPGSSTQRQPIDIEIFVDVSEVLVDSSRQYDGTLIIETLGPTESGEGETVIIEIPLRFSDLR